MGSGLVMTDLGVLGEGVPSGHPTGAGLGRIGITGFGPAKFRRGGMECLLCFGGDPKGIGLLSPIFSPGIGLWLIRIRETGLFLGLLNAGIGLLGIIAFGTGLSLAGLMIRSGTGLSLVGGTKMAGL